MRLRSKKVLTQEEPLALSSNFELFCARRKMSSGAMYALTIKPLWLWAILHAGKDVENRVWTTKFRGMFLLHSSKACSEKEYLQAYEFIYSIAMSPKPRPTTKRSCASTQAKFAEASNLRMYSSRTQASRQASGIWKIVSDSSCKILANLPEKRPLKARLNSLKWIRSLSHCFGNKG